MVTAARLETQVQMADMHHDREFYEASTNGIRIVVSPRYLPEQSRPSDGRHVWAYDIEITNEGKVTVQLRDRHWIITDGNGCEEHVQGPGVVGEQPILNPGDSFEYSSGCPLQTSSGFMAGHYTMVCEDGTTFAANVPAFALDLPQARRTMN